MDDKYKDQFGGRGYPETEDYKAGEEYANARYDKLSDKWPVAYAAFVAGIQWRNERREISK